MADESALIVNVLPSQRADGEGGGRGGEEAEMLAGGWGRGLYDTCDVVWDSSCPSGNANQILVLQAKSRNRGVTTISQDYYGAGKRNVVDSRESQQDQTVVDPGGVVGDDGQRPRGRKVMRLSRGDVGGRFDAELGVEYGEKPLLGFASLVDDIGKCNFSSEWKHVAHRHIY
jgi:hypothetical protein